MGAVSDGMSEERLAQIDASFPLNDSQWRWDTEDAIEAFGYVRELRDEVRRLRKVERDLRATIADKHSRLSQDFENEEQLRQERDQARAELAAMREEIGEVGEEWRVRDAAGWFTIRRLPLSAVDEAYLLREGRPLEKRLVGQWREVEGGDHA